MTGFIISRIHFYQIALTPRAVGKPPRATLDLTTAGNHSLAAQAPFFEEPLNCPRRMEHTFKPLNSKIYSTRSKSIEYLLQVERTYPLGNVLAFSIACSNGKLRILNDVFRIGAKALIPGLRSRCR